jgi:putative NADPH-quinone reductase
MAHKILIIDGHPDADRARYVHALADAYRAGAEQGNHETHLVRVADLDFPILRTQADYETGQPPEAVRSCQTAMEWATHVVILYPLWLGMLPALLKAFLEQLIRPGFAFSTGRLGKSQVKMYRGKTAHVIITMGMPALVYRWYFRAHSLRSLERSVLRFVGFRRVRSTIIGNVAGMSSGRRLEWLERVRAFGREAR